MRRSYPALSDPLEERVKKLESDLYMARAAIIGLMPETLRAAIGSYYTVESREDGFRWKDALTEQIIEYAKPLPTSNPYFGVRAMCPLCGNGSSSPYDEGFSVPEGLRRHLEGYGNMHQCVVAHAVFALAHDFWNSQFHSKEEEARRAHQADIEQRKRSETLYQIELNSAPKLLEEGIAAFRGARHNDDLTWAEKRLDMLGFLLSVDNKIKAYTSAVTDFLVFADPREKGEIVFRVFKNSPSKQRRPSASRAVAQFSIPDRWKHDLPAKYEAVLAKAIGRP
jgi:hypothetical protein